MKTSLIIISLLVSSRILLAQSATDCQCAYTVTQAGTYLNSKLKVQPGQTVCIKAGHYDMLRFNGFTGSADQPIRFVNCGGQVGVGANNITSGIQFVNSSFFILTGSGDARYTYGIVLDKSGSGSSGVTVGGQSTDFEVERVEVAVADYAGFSMKLDPGCDSTTWRDNFTMRNVKLHDNYIHDTGGPGTFIGSSASSTTGTQVTCNGVQKTVYPVQLANLQVYNNRIERTTGVGLGIYNAPNASVYNNTLTNTNLGPWPSGWQTSGSGNCGCDYTLTKADTYNNNRLEVKPGQTVCIQSGQYNYLRLNNFVGTADRPIRFINCGGQVTVGSSSGLSGITFANSRYFVLTGTGDPASNYGIKVTQSNASSGSEMGVSVGSLSSDCEIDHLEVGAANFAGIMVKTDPNCDSTTWRSNFTMYNVKIHHNYVHDTGGEGLYIGNSFYGNGQTVTCKGETKQVYPHLIYGLEVYNNRIERSGCEGLQYGCAPDAKVHDNYIVQPGQSPFASYQNNGLQIGGGAGGDCYNNVVLQSPAVGIIIVGHLGDNRIFNNIVNSSGGDGIFCDDRPGTVAGSFVRIINNTIHNSGRDGIRLYNEINVNTVANNVISKYEVQSSSGGGSSGRPLTLAQGATATSVGNYTLISSASIGYTDAENNDFTLLANSPLIRAGIDASSWGEVVDRLGQSRPVGSPYSIGAYEYMSPSRGRVGTLQGEESADETVQVRAYPSPCTDQIIFGLPLDHLIDRVEVYSMAGRLEAQMQPGVLPSHQIMVATKEWAGGIYTYRIYSGQRVYVGRFIKN